MPTDPARPLLTVPLLCPKSAQLSAHRRFRHGLQVLQALLEIAAEHLVLVHEQANRPGDEIVLAEHGPRDRGAIALGLERELGRAGAGHRLHEIEPDPDELGWAALGQRHAPFADLAVAGPGEDRAFSG